MDEDIHFGWLLCNAPHYYIFIKMRVLLHNEVRMYYILASYYIIECYYIMRCYTPYHETQMSTVQPSQFKPEENWKFGGNHPRES